VLYAGLMITDSGPKVLEFNARFGDPEVQALVWRLKGDLLPILKAAARGELASVEPPDWDPRVCVGVVAAAEGYPAKPRLGDPISGLEEAERVPDAVVFHAGTARHPSGDLVTSSGRVFCVTALGSAMGEARERAYAAFDKIAFEGKLCRRDIGLRMTRRHEGPDADADGPEAILESGAGGPGPPSPRHHKAGAAGRGERGRSAGAGKRPASGGPLA